MATGDPLPPTFTLPILKLTLRMREDPRTVFPKECAEQDLRLAARYAGPLYCILYLHDAMMPERMVRIGIDCRFAGTQGGLGRYTRELVTHLLSRDDRIHYTLFVRSPEEEWLRELLSPITYNVQKTPYPHYSISEQFLFPPLLRRLQLDLLFVPHFNVPFFCPLPTVIVIHDLTLHFYPNEAPLWRRIAYHIVLGKALRAARTIIAVSASTAKDLILHYGKIVRGKVAVIPEGVSDAFTPIAHEEAGRTCRTYGIAKPFFLYVGNAKQHKNVQVLIDAYAGLGSTNFELVLVTAGKEAARLRPAHGVRLLTNVAEQHLPALYSAARTFVTASLYEGYCLPLLEAAACGCPIIATLRGAIPEVAPPGTMLIEPTREALVHALRSPPPSIPSSNLRLPRWDGTAETLARVLLRVAHQE